MCGIVGALELSDRSPGLTAELLTAMRDTLVHRGPDAEGLWLGDDRRVGLGHRRLSIVDLSAAANQPMATPDGRYRIVLNGEIYDHHELRHELEGTGRHDFRTDHSDTETLLHAWAEWGLEALPRLSGMFAFAVWDARERILTLVRDRVGVKPLYIAQDEKRFRFASEIKALLADPSVPAEIDETSFVDALTFLTTPAPRTMFRGVEKLPPAHWLRITADGRRMQGRWWDLATAVEPRTGRSRGELVEELRALLADAVRQRKLGDVPMGVFLSGGIDSSTNATLFAKGEDRPIRTFSIGYDRDYPSYTNELHHARAVATLVGAEHHERRLSVDELLAFIEPMVELQDEPLADPVCVPVHFVSRLAREAGVKVCQVGEGADELFWGYPYWRRSLSLTRWNSLPVPRFAKRLGLSALRAAGKSESHAYELLRRGATGTPLFWGGAEGFRTVGRNRLLSERLRAEHGDRLGWDAIEPIHRRFLDTFWEPHPLQWMSFLDLHFRLPELLLMRVDKMSMAVGLEARVPFLDHRLVEFAMSVPAAEKSRGGVLKGLLKDTVRGTIPDAVIDRPKQGFGVPVHEWFLERLGDRARTEIGDFVDGTDLVSGEQVDRLFAADRGHDLWVLLNIALWWKRFIRR